MKYLPASISVLMVCLMARAEPATQPVDPVAAASGLQIVIQSPGRGATKGDLVIVHYIGRLQDGNEFDNSHRRGDPIQFQLGSGRVIAGWEQGIEGMQVGEKRQLTIPPELAYGAEARGPIPANATLIFDVELVGLRRLASQP
jgi:peptidylprolyl isomerase